MKKLNLLDWDRYSLRYSYDGDLVRRSDVNLDAESVDGFVKGFLFFRKIILIKNKDIFIFPDKKQYRIGDFERVGGFWFLFFRCLFIRTSSKRLYVFFYFSFLDWAASLIEAGQDELDKAEDFSVWLKSKVK